MFVWHFAEFAVVVEAVAEQLESGKPPDWSTAGARAGKTPEEAEFVVMRAKPSDWRASLGLVVVRHDAELPKEVTLMEAEMESIKQHLNLIRDQRVQN